MLVLAAKSRPRGPTEGSKVPKRGPIAFQGAPEGPGEAQLRRREAEFFEVPVSKTPMSMEVLREVFDAIDTDGSGYIETGEIEALMEQLDSRELNGKPSAGEVQKFIKFFDANDDGVVSFQEFVDSFLVTWPLAGEGE